MSVKRNYAFISYSHQDVKVAKWLHRMLESYKLPAEIHNEFEDSKYLRPVFRDQEDLDAGILNNELKKHLENSKYLIVICSPNSAKSGWVSNEVRTFIEWGRLEYIIPFIIDGRPYSGDEYECFPFALLEYVSVHPDRELLGISIKEVGREKAFVRVVSRLLGVSFDELWKRHERERKRKVLFSSIFTPVFLSLLYYLTVPVSLTVEINDDKHQLPLPERSTFILDGAEYSVGRLDTVFTINNLPGYYRGHKLHFDFSPQWYESKNEDINIGWGINSVYVLDLQRDNSFSTFSGKVIGEDGIPIVGAKIFIEGQNQETDNNGKFSLSKEIIIKKDGYMDNSRDDECPDTSLIYMLIKR